jgi:hypothetical protein
MVFDNLGRTVGSGRGGEAAAKEMEPRITRMARMERPSFPIREIREIRGWKYSRK